MFPSLTTRSWVIVVAVMSACALTLSLTGVAAATKVTATQADRPLSTCFWVGPYTTARGEEFNTAFPDSGAIYWPARYTPPSGSRLVFHGQYPHARYMSLNSYNAETAAPTDALNDLHTNPDPGSSNPFLPGALRTDGEHFYTTTVVGTPPPDDPSDREPNTLYAGVPDQDEQMLILRVYVPDKNRDLTGDVGLPEPELQLANGRVLRGEKLCKAVHASQEGLSVTKLPLSTYLSLRDQPDKPSTFPAQNPPLFRAYYNSAFSIQCAYLGECGGNPPRTGGQYSNIDNNYLSAYVNREFGPVLVLRGTLPTTPPTFQRVPVMQEGQLRYWSICQNESYATTRGAGCLYDEQVPVDAENQYTIVTSLPGDRPSNATERCGVGYVPWPENGDGAGHPNDGFVIVRNMLPAADFHQAVQDTKLPGDEEQVLGPYLPRGTYMTTAEFEQLGC